MTLPGSGVGESHPRNRNELPPVTGWQQGKLEDSGPVAAYLAVRLDRRLKAILGSPAGTRHEGPDAIRVGLTIDVLWGKPLILMVMTAENHIHAAGVERLDQGSQSQIRGMRTGAEEGPVPVS